MTRRGTMTERWHDEVIQLDRVSVADDVAGAAPLLLTRRLPSDEATTVDERYHDSEAEVYESYCRVPRVSAAEGWLVPWIRRHASAGITVDLGCGTGRVAKALADPPARHVIAVDRSSGMLEVARRQVPSSGVILLRADARDLPLHDHSVDTVVCSGVLHHMAAWPDALSEVGRVLRPGGRLIVREPNAAYPAWLFAPVEDALERLARWRHGDRRAQGSGQPPRPCRRWNSHTLAETWLGRPLGEAGAGQEHIVRRYLTAFGPASVQDIGAWSGLSRVRAVLDRIAPTLRTFTDEQGRTLFDVADGPRGDPDDAAPARLLPDYDNVLFAHRDRTRVLPEEYRRAVVPTGRRMPGTFLVDGFVAGTWRIVRTGSVAALHLEPFGRIPRPARGELVEEAERLVRFAGGDADRHEVRLP